MPTMGGQQGGMAMGGQGMMMGGGGMGGGGMGGGMGMGGGGMGMNGMAMGGGNDFPVMNDVPLNNDITMGMHGKKTPEKEKKLSKAVAGRIDDSTNLGEDSSLLMGGPLKDSDLDREAMMSPYEENSKDTEGARVRISTEGDSVSQAFVKKKKNKIPKNPSHHHKHHHHHH